MLRLALLAAFLLLPLCVLAQPTLASFDSSRGGDNFELLQFVTFGPGGKIYDVTLTRYGRISSALPPRLRERSHILAQEERLAARKAVFEAFRAEYPEHENNFAQIEASSPVLDPNAVVVTVRDRQQGGKLAGSLRLTFENANGELPFDRVLSPWIAPRIHSDEAPFPVLDVFNGAYEHLQISNGRGAEDARVAGSRAQYSEFLIEHGHDIGPLLLYMLEIELSFRTWQRPLDAPLDEFGRWRPPSEYVAYTPFEMVHEEETKGLTLMQGTPVKGDLYAMRMTRREAMSIVNRYRNRPGLEALKENGIGWFTPFGELISVIPDRRFEAAAVSLDPPKEIVHSAVGIRSRERRREKIRRRIQERKNGAASSRHAARQHPL